jgi:hypothetical protein
MLWFWALSLGLIVVFTIMFRAERLALLDAYARSRAIFLSAARYIVAMVLFLCLPFVHPLTLVTVDIGLFLFALLVLPTSLILRLGGQENKLVLRQVQREATALMAAHDAPPPPDAVAAMELLIGQVNRLRNRDTRELCNLLVARYSDWIDGSSRPLDLGRRSIRVYELDRELYGDEIRPPEHDEEEATFRWRLYRIFGEMVDVGAQPRTPGSRARFKALIGELDAYRRPDTAGFIDSVTASAKAWLKSRRRGAWQPAIGVGELGEAIQEAHRRLWPSASVFWGAILDEADRRELAPARRQGG